jgi:isoamylase
MSPYAARQRGNSAPLGATLVPGGANFSVFSKHSTGAQLLLFDDVDAPKPSRVILRTLRS